MWTTAIALWACSHVGLACAPNPVPTMASIQTAYDREASAGNKLHDTGLRLIEAKCDVKDATERYLCQVTFLSVTDPNVYPGAITGDVSRSGVILQAPG